MYKISNYWGNKLIKNTKNINKIKLVPLEKNKYRVLAETTNAVEVNGVMLPLKSIKWLGRKLKSSKRWKGLPIDQWIDIGEIK